MIDILIALLWKISELRYRVRRTGLENLTPHRPGETGTLFIGNHPSMLDPLFVEMSLWKNFHPRFLIDEGQTKNPVLGFLARQANALIVPDVGKTGGGQDEVRRILDAVCEGLRRGESFLIYPAGRLYRCKNEIIGGNSGTEFILKTVPEARAVLVRTSGMWGSMWSRAETGDTPNIVHALRHALRYLTLNFFFFSPVRSLTIEFTEPSDLPRDGGRRELNQYLERYFNETATPNTYVPRTIWESGETCALPDPEVLASDADISTIPASVQERVREMISTISGMPIEDDEATLASDLGMDSLTRVDFGQRLEKEFGIRLPTPDAIQTVRQAILAASGIHMADEVSLRPLDPRWFKGRFTSKPLLIDPRRTVADAFLETAFRVPDRIAAVDETSGGKTYRELILGIMLFRKRVLAMEGDYIGIMLPASVASVICYFSVMLAGRVPVMVNWTTGERNVEHSLNVVGVRRVLTSGALLKKLEDQGQGMATLRDRFVLLEDLRTTINPVEFLWTRFRARFRGWGWSPLLQSPIQTTAAVLFTSGSEKRPKAVPLTHRNIMSNIDIVIRNVQVVQSDRIMAILPPFHSFGLMANLCTPMVTGMPAVYFPDPTQAGVIARLIGAYQPTLLGATPTFMMRILQAAHGDKLQSLRFCFLGAEKLPDSVVELASRKTPKTAMIEGYGITECAPVVSMNLLEKNIRGSMGMVIQTLSYLIVDPETLKPVPPGTQGMLLVRGPSVFGGYLGKEDSPFVAVNGHHDWYRTGDLVIELPDHPRFLVFKGRLKRFIKKGGEMVSLPAIEEVLAPFFPPGRDGEPRHAVTAFGEDGQADLEVVLFSVDSVDRESVNRRILESGLSGLHRVDRVVTIAEIPLLGTGKTNYRGLLRPE